MTRLVFVDSGQYQLSGAAGRWVIGEWGGVGGGGVEDI